MCANPSLHPTHTGSPITRTLQQSPLFDHRPYEIRYSRYPFVRFYLNASLPSPTAYGTEGRSVSKVVVLLELREVRMEAV